MVNINDFIKNIGNGTVSLEEQQAALAQVEKTMLEAKQIRDEAIGKKADMVVQALKKIESKLEAKLVELNNTPAKQGVAGPKGEKGRDGRDGKDGYKGQDGKDGVDGQDGKDGSDGISVADAQIDFDGSLLIILSDGREIDAGTVIPLDVAKQIHSVSTNGGGTSQSVLDSIAALQTQINSLIPSQTGNSGKYLTTDGTNTSWGTVTSGSGTVTSVAATVPSFLSVTGSPITTSGTLALTYSGTALPVANGGTGGTTATAGFNALAPSQTSNSGKYLTTDGTNASWATVSGGVTGFTSGENTTAPNGTVYVDYLQASATSINADVAFIAKGTGATLAQIPDSTITGGNKRGGYAVDFQKYRQAAGQVASGLASFIGGGGINSATATYSTVVAGTSNSANANYSAVVGGSSNSANGSFSFVGGGNGSTASGDYSFLGGGNTNTASSPYSFIGGGSSNAASTTTTGYNVVVGGTNNQATGSYSAILGGSNGTTRSIVGMQTIPACNAPISSTLGVSQSSLLILGVQTTDATATVLRSNTSAAGTTNQIILPNNSAYFFKGEVVSGVTGGGNTKGWYIEGVIKRGSGVGTTALVGTPTVTSLYADAGAATWALAVTADTSNGGLAVTFTGQAATTIRTVCKIQTTEMTY